MNHLQRIYRCTSEHNADKLAKTIADDIERYSQALYSRIDLQELLPKRINYNGTIEDSAVGRTFRRNYARWLSRAWVRRNQKTIIESAYSIALRKITKELHLSTRAAKHILLQRSKSEFFEYEREL